MTNDVRENHADSDERVHLGPLELPEDRMETGIPTNQTLLLRVTFYTSRTSYTTQQTLLAPSPGSRYTLNARYKDSMHDLTVKERSAAGTRTLQTRQTCR